MQILYKISLTFCLFLATATSQAANVVWFDGHSRVGYVAQQSYSTVVKTALSLFSEDMKAVTGLPAEENHKGKIEIIELSTLTNKEFKKIQKRKLPYQKVIAKPDAFYIGVHSGRIVVIGDNARGTAYGILELSRMAGVSPWIWWGDIVPERRKRLETDEHFTTLQLPSVDFRGISITDENLIRQDRNGQKLFGLLLRLRANTLFQLETNALVKNYRKTAESFGILIESGLKNPASAWKDDAPWNPSFYSSLTTHSAFTWKDDDPWLSTTQPGLVFYKARNAYQKGTRKAWAAYIRNPKTCAYPLSLFLDMAWNEHAVTAKNMEQHLEKWLEQQFGKTNGHKLLPVMRKFYELTAVCKPEDMDKSLFNALAFGNELERYLGEYTILQKITENIGKNIRPELHDAYFSAIKYPIQAATAIAVKQLEAQEARHIARKESFHRDSEALSSAARSIKAWRKLHQLTQHYQEMGRGKWNRTFPEALSRLPAFAMPDLPDQLSEAEIDKYGEDEDYQIQINTGDCIVRNAADYTSATEDAELIPLLGNSLRAVALNNGGKVNYKFSVAKGGTATLRITLAATNSGQPLFSVSIDGNEYAHTQNALSLGSGTHTLTIKALEDNLLLDQWMIDFNPKRQFYRFPL